MVKDNGRKQISNSNMLVRKIGVPVIILGIVICGFLIRIQVDVNIPTEQFTDPDGYLYYWQAQHISEHGSLPERDMHRWLPLGRDNRQTLNFYSYALAYTHKAVAWVIPDISLYHVTRYMPVVCFCIGLSVLCIFLYRTHDLLFSGIVGVILATLPGAIERSTVGLGDRDSWCLMLGVLVLLTYLISLQTQSTRKRLLWTLTNGIIIFIGGLSWEGFGVFLSIILCVELWKFLSTEAEEGLGFYLIWVLSFVPTLYLAFPAYRIGHGYAKHLFAFVIVPPLVLLGIRSLRYFLTSKKTFIGLGFPFAEKISPHARVLALGLTLAFITYIAGYILIQRHTFSDTTVLFSKSGLMQSVAELESTFLMYWMTRYGSVFVLGSLGIIISGFRFWQKWGIVLAVPLSLFTVAAYYGSVLDYFWGVSVSRLFFGFAIATCILGLIVLASRRRDVPTNELVYIAFAGWLIFWAVLSRDAKRYDFFLGISFAFFTTDLIRYLADFYGDKVKQRLPRYLLKACVLGITLSLILFFRPFGGYMTRTLYAATQLRQATPGRGSLAETFNWLKNNLPSSTVVAAHWNYGSQLNVLAGVKTIVDQDHYIPHWIHLYEQSINFAKTEHEALEFLKSHTVTHLMLTGQETATAPFLRGEKSEHFIPVYPTSNFKKALVKVWEIRYTPDIKPNPKHLETVPEE